LTLASTGAISGTPTTSGSYTFAATVHDSAAQTASYTYSTSIGASTTTTSTTTTTTGPVFQESFDSGAFSTKWSQIWNPTDVGITTSMSHSSPGSMQIHYHICGTPAPPTLGQVAGGSLPATTYYVKVTGSNNGETLPSAEASIAVPAGSLLTVQLPPAQPDLTGANVYVGTASGAETLQGSAAQGALWTEPATGLVSGGAAPPTAFTTTACGGSAQDLNRFAGATFNSTNGYPGGLSPIYVRAWFYFKTPEADSSAAFQIQRKLFYLQDVPSPSNWGVVLTSFTYPAGVGLTPQIGSAAGTPTIASLNYWDVYNVPFNTWTEIEFGVVPNSPGNSDGSLTLWINGTQVWQQTGINIRGSATDGIGWVMVGQQANRGTFNPIDEYRYIDDVAIGTSYIP
jgi:hypothetical protein